MGRAPFKSTKCQSDKPTIRLSCLMSNNCTQIMLKHLLHAQSSQQRDYQQLVSSFGALRLRPKLLPGLCRASGPRFGSRLLNF